MEKPRDCKLLYAECLANDGELAAAMQEVNDIRERAAKEANIIYLDDGTPAANYLVNPYPSSHAAFTDKATCVKAIRMSVSWNWRWRDNVSSTWPVGVVITCTKSCKPT